MKTRKLLSLILAMLMVVTLLSGCTQPAEQPAPAPAPSPEQPQPAPVPEAPKAEQILKFGGSGWGGLFNPIMEDNVYDDYVSDLIFEPLVDNNKEGEYVPELATWTISDDHLTYIFTLKDGIKF